MPDGSLRAATAACDVAVRLADGTAFDGTLRLLVDGASPGGVVPVRAVLEGDRLFLPLLLHDGTSLLVARDAIEILELAADAPGAPAGPRDDASLDVVTVHLASGGSLSGVLSTVTQEGHGRMSDVFNAPARFLVLSIGDRVALVNKSRVVRASF